MGEIELLTHNHDSWTIDIVDSLEDKLEALAPLSKDCCIFRAPQQLRHHNETIFKPRVVSIGPFHHKAGLKSMVEHKDKYLKDFLSRTEVHMKEFVEFIAKNETKVRNSYAEIIDLSRNEFVEMVLLDSIFIIEFMLRISFPQFCTEGDWLFGRPWTDLGHDLCLLENQLPFFILEDIYDLAKITLPSSGGAEERQSFAHITLNYFKRFIAGDPGDSKKTIEASINNIKHFVDFLRIMHQPSAQRKAVNGFDFSGITHKPSVRQKAVGGLIFKDGFAPAVTELHKSGVKFKNADHRGLLDITFEKGVLKIPNICLNEHSESYFSNILAFEQCYCEDNETYMNDYIVFMDRFINTSEDVDLLIQNGILDSWLGSSTETASLFNKLGKGAISKGLEYFHFQPLSGQLKGHYQNPWNKWKANLRQKYFATPWSVISFLAATCALVLTLIQTVLSFNK